MKSSAGKTKRNFISERKNLNRNFQSFLNSTEIKLKFFLKIVFILYIKIGRECQLSFHRFIFHDHDSFWVFFVGVFTADSDDAEVQLTAFGRISCEFGGDACVALCAVLESLKGKFKLIKSENILLTQIHLSTANPVSFIFGRAIFHEVVASKRQQSTSSLTLDKLNFVGIERDFRHVNTAKIF